MMPANSKVIPWQLRMELLKKEPDVPKIIFSTYQSSPKLFEACEREKDLIFDLVLADEAHRCAGKVETAFSTVHRLRTRRRLFMTATPRIYSTEVKTRSKNQGFEIISMDDDEKFGPLFYKNFYLNPFPITLLFMTLLNNYTGC